MCWKSYNKNSTFFQAAECAEDGETILANGQAAGAGQAAIVSFRAPAAGSYYIKIDPLTTYLFGTDAVYGVSVFEINKAFLPLVAR